MKEAFLIGELATLFNISADTLRYYDKIGLIEPDVKGDNGYRYYSLRSFFKLSRILFLRDLDIPLEEIKGYMSNKNTEKLVQMLESKRHDLDHKIQSCLNLKAKIDQKLALLNTSRNANDSIYLKVLPPRRVLTLSSSDQRNATSVKQTLKAYGHLLKHSSWMTEGQIYTSVSEAHLDLGIFEHFDYLFELPLDGVESSQTNAELPVLPQAEYACLLFVGPYHHIDQHYQRLLQWIATSGYRVCGPSIEKNIVDYDFADSDEEYISELLIPIKKS